jgi:hypothetical protein
MYEVIHDETKLDLKVSVVKSIYFHILIVQTV